MLNNPVHHNPTVMGQCFSCVSVHMYVWFVYLLAKHYENTGQIKENSKSNLWVKNYKSIQFKMAVTAI